MKLKYIFLVLFGIIIFLILNNIDTFNIGIPYIWNPPVDTPIPDQLDQYRGRIWNTLEEMQEELGVNFDLIDDPTNEINFIPESNESLTINTNNGNINFDVVNTIGRVNVREQGCEKRVVISKGSSNGTTLDDTDINISDTEFAIKLSRYKNDATSIDQYMCVRRNDVSITIDDQHVESCQRYIVLSNPTIGTMSSYFNFQNLSSVPNISKIIAPFLYLMFCQLNISNLKIPNRFQLFFSGSQLVAFETSSIGNATKMNMFHMNDYVLAMDPLGDDILNPLDVDIFPDLSPLTTDEIHVIETTHMHLIPNELKKKYIKHIRNLINDDNILLSIKARIYIFLDEDPQFIINGDNIGVLDFDMTETYSTLINITYEDYYNLTHQELNTRIIRFYDLEFLQVFGHFTQKELLDITYNIYNIYTSMIQLGFMNLEHINRLFKNILYSIKYAYQRFLNITWGIGTTEDFLSGQFIQLENLLFNADENSDVIFPTAEEGIPVVEISDDDDDDDYLCDHEPGPEPDACAAIPHTTSDSS